MLMTWDFPRYKLKNKFIFCIPKITYNDQGFSKVILSNDWCISYWEPDMYTNCHWEISTKSKVFIFDNIYSWCEYRFPRPQFDF